MTNGVFCAILYLMKLIEKPDVEDWPDIVSLTVNGVPVRIDYKNQMIMVPNEAMERQDNIAAYLIDEGIVITTD